MRRKNKIAALAGITGMLSLSYLMLSPQETQVSLQAYDPSPMLYGVTEEPLCEIGEQQVIIEQSVVALEPVHDFMMDSTKICTYDRRLNGYICLGGRFRHKETREELSVGYMVITKCKKEKKPLLASFRND